MKKTTDDFIKEAHNIHNGKYGYSKVEYVNNYTKVIIICPKHGEFLQIPYHHLNGHGCRKCSFEKSSVLFRSTKTEFVKKANKIHGSKYDYSKFKYVHSHVVGIIICPKHGEFLQTPSTHVVSGCIKCSIEYKTKSLKSFISESKKIHKNKYDYSSADYINSYTNIVIICPKHGKFLQKPSSHLKGHGCTKCSIERQIKSKKIFIEEANEIHENKYDYSKVKYIGANKKVKIICPEHGVFLQSPTNHLNGSGCKKCSKSIKRIENMKSFIQKSKIIHKNKYNYSKVKYVNNHTKVIIICPEHGEFLQISNSHLNGSGCPHCSSCVSKISQLWLDSLRVPKKYREKTIKVGKYKYRVDALDRKNKIVYEFNGDFWHGNPKMFDPKNINPIANITFGELYNKTIEKENELKNAGFKVVSIWESEFIKYGTHK